MKRRLTQVVGSVVLCGAIVGASQITYAQDGLSKQARKDTAWQAKMERDYTKLDRWLARQETKRSSKLTKEQKFDTPYTARGSEVGFMSQGQFVAVGYIDKSNKFRSYR